jgi:hypothetical protein
MNEDLTRLINDTTRARAQVQLAAELHQNDLLFLLAQSIGTTIKVLEHVERQDRNIKFLYKEWENIKHGDSK